MQDRLNNSLNELKELVLKFQENDLDLTDIPQAQIDEFGYACLANSLMFKEPQIPKYHSKEITSHMKNHRFDTLDSLISYIKSLDDDVDKLYSIFSYEALNIQYDTESFFKNEIKTTTLGEIFDKKIAVCSGYALFFYEMSKRVNLNANRVKVKCYSNYAKGFGFDALNPPQKVKSNHLSIFITIDGIQFISEPTWAAGHITSDHKFEWCYRPQLFLIPVYKSLCDHYPCSPSTKYLNFKLSYSQYLKSCRILSFDRSLKTESNPFVNFECSNGYVEQVYSCKGPVDWISIHLFKKNNDGSFSQVSGSGITSYQIIQKKMSKHPERTRFKTNIALQEEGTFQVKLFIESPFATEYFVNNLKKCSMSVPLTYNPFHECRFIPITPKKILTEINKGYALIRFAVIPKRSDLLWSIIKLENENGFNYKKGEIISREYGKYISLNIPFDNERYEDQLCITFPSIGRYCVLIYLSNDIGSYSIYTKYFFDVKKVISEKVKPLNPVEFMFSGRKFSPKKIVDANNNNVIIKPNQNCFLTDKTEQSIRIKSNSINDHIHLEFKQDDKKIDKPVESGHFADFRRFKWSIPDVEGEYHLLCWINDYFCFALTYFYRKLPLKNPTKEEIELLDELKSKTDQDDEKIEDKKLEQKKNLLYNFSSKCCLLI